ncbi:MAG: type II secretion system protein [Candidatus Omnitrophota bacterium]|jgi:type II secretory pathway pseudopilin PulG
MKEHSFSLKSRNFTLVEIMIVVTVIMILVFAFVPSMLRARVTSNEATAVANARALYTSLQMYYTDNNKRYPTELSQLAGYTTSQLASGSKSGYLFNYTYDGPDSFHININPRTPGKTGTRYFYLDENNILRVNPEGEATDNDPPAE